MTDIRQLFARRIREIRKTVGWRQEDIAKRLRMTRTNYINLEKGRQSVNMEMVENIARAFFMSPKDLLKNVWWGKKENI